VAFFNLCVAGWCRFEYPQIPAYGGNDLLPGAGAGIFAPRLESDLRSIFVLFFSSLMPTSRGCMVALQKPIIS
jgi:hypothetical protein